ncbi:Ldh family oxidoreductase [archaeon]
MIEANVLKGFVSDVLVAHGVAEDYASVTADVLVEADLRGHNSHGVSRLGRILTGIKAGTHNPSGRAEVEQDKGATALLTGNQGLGHPVAKEAMKLAIKKAKEYGIGSVGIHNTTHFGMAGYYSELAAEQGMIGITVCNTEPAIAAFGGNKKIVGTNPIAFAAPYTEGRPVLVDMATSAIARGKALEASRKGEKLPPMVAMDSEGNPTQDPKKALDGSLIAIGSAFAYKGFGLAMAFDLLSGALVRGHCGTDVHGSATTTERSTVGDFMIAINIANFTDISEFKQKTSKLVDEVKESGEGVLYPGEKEQVTRDERLKNGIPLDEGLISELRKMGREVNVNLE